MSVPHGPARPCHCGGFSSTYSRTRPGTPATWTSSANSLTARPEITRATSSSSATASPFSQGMPPVHSARSELRPPTRHGFGPRGWIGTADQDGRTTLDKGLVSCLRKCAARSSSPVCSMIWKKPANGRRLRCSPTVASSEVAHTLPVPAGYGGRCRRSARFVL
jgi:hypothetical protein